MKINNKLYITSTTPENMFNSIIFTLPDGTKVEIEDYELQKICSILDFADIDGQEEIKDRAYDNGFEDGYKEAETEAENKIDNAHDKGYDEGYNTCKEEQNIEIDSLKNKIEEIEYLMSRLEDEKYRFEQKLIKECDNSFEAGYRAAEEDIGKNKNE